MMELADLPERIDRLRTRASTAAADERLMTEMEDLLAEGYLAALRGEACSRRLSMRLEEVMSTLDQPASAVEAQRIVREKRSLDCEVQELRAQLAVIRDEFARLGGGNPSAG